MRDQSGLRQSGLRLDSGRLREAEWFSETALTTPAVERSQLASAGGPFSESRRSTSNADSDWSPTGVRLESDWSPTGVRLESDWSPTGVRMKSDSSPSGVQVESEWSLSGVRVESSGVRSDTASWFHLYFTRDP